jgi:anthranilate phosphoribosyltransferase
MRARATPLPDRWLMSLIHVAPAATARTPFNVSTAAAIVLAGAGVRVAKARQPCRVEPIGIG